MKRFAWFSASLAASVLALAACSGDSTGPGARAPVAPARAVEAGAAQHLVLFRGNGVPTDFAAQVAALGGSVSYANGGAGFALVSGLNDAAAAQVGAMKTVSEVQADVAISLDAPAGVAEADASDAIASQANPATALRYIWQWNMRLINANQAWAAGKLGSAGVTVAILDTGIDYDAPDLNGLVDLSRSASFIPSDDAITTTYFPTRSRISDYNGHGTNVATQVSSKAFALAGVTSRTTLIGVKVLGANGGGTLGSVLSGVLWAADHGANVANMSLGGGFAKAGNGRYVSLINRVFNYAQRQGMLIVVAAGNETEDLDHNGNELKTYCDVVHVICVSAVGPATALIDQDAPAYYTNFGRSAVSVAAPGGNADAAHGFPASPRPWGNDIASWVWSYCSKTRIAGFTGTGVPILTSCVAGNRLTGYIGTSQASPHVAGLAALLMAEYGTGNPAQIKNRITGSAVDLGETGTDPFYGRGRIDVARALGL
jgi:subtilisin family serine protease